jgi:hypothetical protein
MITGKKEDKSINFLQPVGASESVVFTSFNWLGTIGKNLLLVVQIVVLVVFALRIVMDGKNNDLTSKINSQVGILENETWKKNAIKYENLQNLMGDIKLIGEEQELNSNLISEILSAIPLTLNLENISFTNGRVALSLKTTDFKALKDYEDALKNNSYYSDVRFNISKTGDELEVSVSFNIKEEVK